MQELGRLIGPTKILSSNSIISEELSETELFFICCPAGIEYRVLLRKDVTKRKEENLASIYIRGIGANTPATLNFISFGPIEKERKVTP